MRLKIPAFILPMVFTTAISVSTNIGANDSIPHYKALASVKALARAMGGEQQVLSVTSQQILSNVTRFEPEQTHEPGQDPMFVGEIQHSLTKDLRARRSLAEWRNESDFPLVSTYISTEIINHDHGAVIGTDGFFTTTPQAPMLSIRIGARVKQYFITSPLALVQHALAHAEELVAMGSKEIGHRRHDVVSVPGWNQPILMYIDRASKLLTTVETWEDDPVYGDTLWQVRFDNWAVTGELKLPYNLTSALNDKVVAVEARDAIYLDVVIDDSVFDIPQELQIPPQADQIAWGIRSSQYFTRMLTFGAPFDIDQTNTVEFSQIADNVYHVLGSLHNSLVIEMSDFLVVVDPVLYDSRTQTIIRKIAEQWPTKPIRFVVASHFHADHMGGVRGYGLTGATLLVGEGTKDHYEAVFKAPHTIYPDSYALNPSKVKIESVDADDPFIISDGERTIRIVDIPNRHSVGLLMPLIEDVKMAFVADLYITAFEGPIPPRFKYWAFDLYDALTASDLDIEFIAAAHGGVVTYEHFLHQVEISR